MKPFSFENPCPKCGSELVRATFVGNLDTLEREEAPDFEKGLLRRDCATCQYHWYELPLDSKKAGKEE